MQLQDIKLIAFDLDGTLVDSAPDLALGINGMLADLGRETFSAEQIRHWVGNGAEVLIKRALSGSDEICSSISDELYQQAKPLFIQHYTEKLCVDSELYPGVAEGLAKLKNLGLPMVVITNKPAVFTEPLLKLLGIDGYFELSLSGDSLDKKKPDPLPLNWVLQRFGLEPSQMLMVGDSKNDIQAAKAAGCPSLGLTYGYNYGEDIALCQPELVADSICLLTDKLEQLDSQLV